MKYTIPQILGKLIPGYHVQLYVLSLGERHNKGIYAWDEEKGHFLGDDFNLAEDLVGKLALVEIELPW